MEFDFSVENRQASNQTRDLIAVGLPFARGVVPTPEHLRMVAADGRPVPAQFRVLAHWPAGGVRWALARFVAGIPAQSTARFRVQVLPAPAPGGLSADAVIQRLPGDGLRIDTGLVRLELGNDPREWIRSVSLPPNPNGKIAEWSSWTPAAAGGQLYAMLTDEALRARFDGPGRILDNGPLVGEILYHGSFTNTVGDESLRFYLRLVAHKDSGMVRISHTLHNPRHQPREELGHWHLGLPNGVLLRQAGLRLGLPKEGLPYVYLAGEAVTPGAGGQPVASPEVGAAAGTDGADWLGPLTGSAWLHQNSSGGAHWRHRNHMNRDRKITTQFRGYRMLVDGRVTYSGHRSAGWAAVGNQRLGVAIGVEKFWQNFPSAIGATLDTEGAVLDCALFPDEGPGFEQELQGGEQKTHHLVVSFHRTDMAMDIQPHTVPVPNLVYDGLKPRFERLLNQPLTLPSAEQTIASQFMQPTVAHDPARFPEYEALCNGPIADPTFNLYDLREKWDEYGWRSFGDIVADGEIHGRIHSHYNNEYDFSRGMLFQALRHSGVNADRARAWADLGLDAARHQADIDIYHTREDPFEGGIYNGAKFTHTAHALEVGRATHRQADCFAIWGELDWPWGRGGGPESGHFDNEGMMLAHYLTGDPILRNAALEIAECVVFKTSNNKFAQNFYDRMGGNNLACVLEAWRNTWDDRYLACIETILDKCRLQNSLGESLQLDAEGLAPIGGWSASIFLKATARFIYEYRQVAGEIHAKAWTILREYADCWHKYGWDENLGRFHPVVRHPAQQNKSGFGADYADAAWFTIDALAFAAQFREDEALRQRDWSRCIRAYRSYCAERAPGARPTYWNTKVATYTTNNGHAVLVALAQQPTPPPHPKTARKTAGGRKPHPQRPPKTTAKKKRARSPRTPRSAQRAPRLRAAARKRRR